ncbi:hypothetical protein [Pseudomonas nicosulfuronedens]
MRSEISHLTLGEIEELYRRYLAGEKNADLVVEYKISIHPNSLIKILPPVKLETTYCPYCKVQMHEKRKSKSDSSLSNNGAFCKKCDHIIVVSPAWGSARQCNCKPCVQQRVHEKEKRDQSLREEVKNYWAPRIGEPYPYKDLDTEEKIYLLSIINTQADANFLTIQSVSERSTEYRLAPTDTQESEILRFLFRRKLISVDPSSPLSAFKPGEVASAHTNDVRWIINIKLESESRRSSIELIQRKLTKDLSLASFDADTHQIKAIVLKVLTEQVIQRIRHLCKKLSLPFAAEKKGREVAATLLLNHSLSEVCYFAYLSVGKASEYHLSTGTGKVKASNIIPNKMQSYGFGQRPKDGHRNRNISPTTLDRKSVK